MAVTAMRAHRGANSMITRLAAQLEAIKTPQKLSGFSPVPRTRSRALSPQLTIDRAVPS
jgi:hypothetical protein